MAGRLDRFFAELTEELTTYVRFVAWLGTSPQATKSKRLSGEEAAESVTRLAKMQADGIDPEMPPLSAPNIINYLMEIGPVEPAGMGVAAVSWSSIHHWQQHTLVPLPAWQARLIRSLSTAYASEICRARDEDAAAPWTPASGVSEEQRASVSSKIKAIFGGLARNKREG